VQEEGWCPRGGSDKPVYHAYYYWYANALKRNFDKTGNTTLLEAVLPAYKAQFQLYATAVLPVNKMMMMVAIDKSGSECLYNVPGNDAQEGAISGPGCRPLVQSTMYGEAAALAELFAAVGDEDSAAEMAAEARTWQMRVLQQWNTDLASFDTIHPNVEPMPLGWALIHNGTTCNTTFLFQGFDRRAGCINRCLANTNCHFMIFNDVMDWCQLQQECSSVIPHYGLGTPLTWQRPAADSADATSIFGHDGQGGGSSDQNENENRNKNRSESDGSGSGWTFAGVRELASLTSPWMFSVVPRGNASAYAKSWDSAFDPNGLGGPHGLRTAEKRHPGYYCDAGCCSWAGPVWPYETAKGITAAINVINNYPSVTTMDGSKFWTLLSDYTAMHTTKWRVMSSRSTFYTNLTNSNMAPFLIDGLGEHWVAENGCGDDHWTKQTNLGGPAWTDTATNGYRYNHATFMDLVLSGVVGLQPKANGTLVVNPLVPAAVLPWWTADGVALHRRIVTVVFDADGSKYGKGAGLKVMVDGITTASSLTLKPLTVQL
jgi:hypothetical protein